MCAPGCVEYVRSKLTRRGFFKARGSRSRHGRATVWGSGQAEAQAFPRFSRLVDLTHTHTPEFPTFFGTPGVTLKQVKTFKTDGFNMYEWTVLEHSGTHMDAPIHFAEKGDGPDTLPVSQLVVPLAVINVADQARATPTISSRPLISGAGSGATAGCRAAAAWR